MPILYSYTGSLENYNIVEKNSNIQGLGIVYPFSDSGKMFDMSLTTIQVAKSNIKMLLQTEQGERAMRPDYGINLRQFCFEPITEELYILMKDRILESISKWIPFVIIDKIDIEFNDMDVDYNAITIKMKFYLKDDNEIKDSIVHIIHP